MQVRDEVRRYRVTLAAIAMVPLSVYAVAQEPRMAPPVGKFLDKHIGQPADGKAVAQSIMKRSNLFFLCWLLLGCSPSPQPPNQASAPKAKAANAAARDQITEKQALDLLLSSLKQHKIAGLDCLAFVAEDTSPNQLKAARWEFAAREIHNDRCGGDPAVAPVRDRYAVSASGKVLVYNAAEADYTDL